MDNTDLDAILSRLESIEKRIKAYSDSSSDIFKATTKTTLTVISCIEGLTESNREMMLLVKDTLRMMRLVVPGQEVEPGAMDEMLKLLGGDENGHRRKNDGNG